MSRELAGSSRGFKRLAIALLVLGIFFRFYHLGHKVYWIDETYTSLRISGHRESELVQQLYTGTVIDVEDLQTYQQPHADRGVADTLNSLAESPQHPPLYFLLGRAWEQILPHSKATLRLLSAIFSLMIFPALYWLCWELFQSALVGWMAIALFAISPFQVLYAQEARQYSLWMVLIVTSSAALLWAMRSDQQPEAGLSKKISLVPWGVYALTLTLGFYTFLFSFLVAIAHALYVGFMALTRPIPIQRRTLVHACVATVAAILAFTPWLWVMLENFGRVTGTASWTNQRFPLYWLVLRWLLYPANQFFDLSLGDRYLTSPALLILLAIVGLMGYSIYFLCRTAPRPATGFVLTLIAVPALILILPDLIVGGQRSATARYMIPCYLGIQLAVAYCLAHKWTSTKNYQQRQGWQAGAIGLLLLGVISCGISSQATLWWTKSPDKHQHNDRIAAILNQSNQPLLISDDSTELSDCFACRMLSLSYELDAKVKLQLIQQPTVPDIPTDRNVFAFTPSQSLIRRIERQQGYQAQLVFEEDNFWLWQLQAEESAGTQPTIQTNAK